MTKQEEMQERLKILTGNKDFKVFVDSQKEKNKLVKQLTKIGIENAEEKVFVK